MQDAKQMNSNITVDNFIDMVLDFVLQINFKKLPLIKFRYKFKYKYPQLSPSSYYRCIYHCETGFSSSTSIKTAYFNGLKAERVVRI